MSIVSTVISPSDGAKKSSFQSRYRKKTEKRNFLISFSVFFFWDEFKFNAQKEKKKTPEEKETKLVLGKERKYSWTGLAYDGKQRHKRHPMPAAPSIYANFEYWAALVLICSLRMSMLKLP